MTSSSTKHRVQNQYDNSSLEKVRKYRDRFWRFYYKSSFGNILSDEISRMEENIDKDQIRILDLGTGAGLYTHLLQASNRDIVGADISRTAVQLAQQELGDQASFIQGDGEQLGIASGLIDIVVCMGTFEYIDELAPILEEISRVLSSSGYLLFSAHNAESFRDRAAESRTVPVAEHTYSDLNNVLNRSGFEINFSKTVYTVPSLLKKGFMSERVPDPFRLLSLFGSVILEYIAECIPFLRKHGDFWLISSQKVE